MSRIKKITAKSFNVPMRDLFKTARGAKNQSHNTMVWVELESGARGYGEASSSLAMPEAVPRNIIPAINRLARELDDCSISSFGNPQRIKIHSRFPAAAGALEAALLTAYAQEKKRPLYSLFGPRKSPIETDVTLSIWPLNKTMTIAAGHYRKGFRRFKMKTSGPSFKSDLNRIEKLTSCFHVQLWIDANGGLSTRQFQQLMHNAQKQHWPITAIEQPFSPKRDGELKKLKKTCPYPLYADESVKTIQDLQKIIRQKSFDGIVVKIAKSGLGPSVRMAKTARAARLKVMISCMAESAAGLAASVSWALGDGKFDWVDLDSYLLTRSRVPQDVFRARGPLLMPPLK